MPQVLIQRYKNEPDSLTSVEWDEKLEQTAGQNVELKLLINSHYDIYIKYYENSFGGSSFFTIQSSGDSGVESNIAMTRSACLLLARETYGAPHCAEFEQIVDRLLISHEKVGVK